MKLFRILLPLLCASHCYSQTSRPVSAFATAQVNLTATDRTTSNNSSGPGLGLQAVLQTKTRVKPVVELNADLFAGTKELYTLTDGTIIEAKSGVLAVYGGALLEPSATFFATATAGTSFYNGHAHIGVRPSLGFYFSKKQTWLLKTGYTHIWQHDNTGYEPFGYFSIALGGRLF